MSKYEGTKTKDNLMAAFAGESMAHTKYAYYASVAKKAGYEQIAEIWQETSLNEKEHAKLWFKELELLGDVSYNLKASAEGENHEWTEMYPEFAKVAREEGFEALAKRFELVAQVEEAHEKRYKKLMERIDENTVFKGDAPVAWKCRNCGYITEGETPPKVCPTCLHPQAYFERLAQNY